MLCQHEGRESLECQITPSVRNLFLRVFLVFHTSPKVSFSCPEISSPVVVFLTSPNPTVPSGNVFTMNRTLHFCSSQPHPLSHRVPFFWNFGFPPRTGTFLGTLFRSKRFSSRRSLPQFLLRPGGLTSEPPVSFPTCKTGARFPSVFP